MKRITAAVLAAATVTGMHVYAAGFTDMKNYEWAQQSVNVLSQMGVIKGVSETEFSPGTYMKRGDFAMLLSRYFSLEETYGLNYSDVPYDSYYADAILRIKAQKIYEGETFEPERAITREEAAGLIYNAIYNTSGITEEQFCDNAAQYYSDADKIKWDKVNAAATLTKMGIIHGDGGKFMPKDEMTRAQLAVMFYNMEKVREAEDAAKEAALNSMKAAVKITSDTQENMKQYYADEVNQSVVWAENSSYTANGVTLTKRSGESTVPENSIYSGLNAALAIKSSNASLTNVSVLSGAENADAVFADGNSIVNISGSALAATGNGSSAAAAAGSAVMNISNTRMSAEGANAPAIRAFDGSSITGDGLYIVTGNEMSPGIYSAGRVTLNNTKVSLAKAYSAAIDGTGSVSANSSALSGKGILIFNSENGNTKDGTGHFSAFKTNIASDGDSVFFVTNTDAEITLEASDISLPSGRVLLKAMADKWGNDGSNGGHAVINAQNQKLSGDIVTDGISSVTMNLKAKSLYSGALNPANYTGAMNISLSADSTWELSTDSYVTVFENEDAQCGNINTNGHNITYDPGAPGNKWLDGKTIPLFGGGVLKPAY